MVLYPQHAGFYVIFTTIVSPRQVVVTVRALPEGPPGETSLISQEETSCTSQREWP